MINKDIFRYRIDDNQKGTDYNMREPDERGTKKGKKIWRIE